MGGVDRIISRGGRGAELKFHTSKNGPFYVISFKYIRINNNKSLKTNISISKVGSPPPGFAPDMGWGGGEWADPECIIFNDCNYMEICLSISYDLQGGQIPMIIKNWKRKVNYYNV